MSQTRYAAAHDAPDAHFACLLLALARLRRERAAPRALAFEQPESESGFTPKPLVTAKQHMVVAAHPLAAEAGLAMLRKGGSAIDAGIATQMVLNLVEPQSSGIGGGAFMLYWDAGAKKLASIDGRETAPAAATPELFLDEEGKPLPRDAAMASGLSVGVPGVLAALKLVHDKYGKLPWAELFQPAIALAREGFPISPRLAKLIAEIGPAKLRAGRARLFLRRARQALARPATSSTIPALADTFETIARDGRRGLLRGRHRQRHRQRGAKRSAQARQAHRAGFRQLSRQRARADLRALSRASRSAAWGHRPPAASPWRRCSASSSRSISAQRRSARAPRI